MCCVTVLRSAAVECLALKPCWVGERGMSWVMRLRISPSRILRGLHRRDIGLWEYGSVGDLDGFRIGAILSSFQMLGMLFCWIDRLKMSVRAPMATGRSCFRCLYVKQNTYKQLELGGS